jgi:hypothetical protein
MKDTDHILLRIFNESQVWHKDSGRMTDQTIEQLDAHRGMTAQKETETRRCLAGVRREQAELHERRTKFEDLVLAAPSANWPEAAARAGYLIQLFAETLEARDPRRQKLIADVLNDLARLSGADGSAGRQSGESPTSDISS